nr:pentatricopeptide repeat-containing protein At1g62910-like [Arachis hypogaea]
MPYAHRTRLCLLHSQPLPSRDAYKFDNLEDVVALFNCKVDMHPQPSIVELTKILGTIVKMKSDGFCTLGNKQGLYLNGKILDALYIYGKIVAKGFWFDEVMYETLINGLCKSGETRVALQRLWKMEGQFVKANLVMYNIVVDGLCKGGLLNDALDLYFNMLGRGISPDIVTYTSIIYGFCHINRVDEAMNLRKDMFLKNIVPNIVTYNSLVDSLCKAGRISSAREIVNEMHYCGQPFPDVNTYNILLDFVCKNQHLDEAIALFKSLIYERSFVPNVWSYNILISGYYKNKRFDEAIKLFLYMCSKNLDPNIETYNILLHALYDRQQLGKAIILLNQIVDDDICLNFCLVTSILSDVPSTKKSSDSSFMISLTSLGRKLSTQEAETTYSGKKIPGMLNLLAMWIVYGKHVSETIQLGSGTNSSKSFSTSSHKNACRIQQINGIAK